MKFKTVLMGVTIAAGFATGVVAQDDPVTVGFVYVGPVGDGGWTYEHEQGALPWKNISAMPSKPSMSKAFPKGPTPSV